VANEQQQSTPEGPGNAGSRSDAGLAAALESRSGRARDARLIAKAKGPLAAEIVQLAEAHGIAIHSDADLAEILVALEEDSEVPLGALAAVAEILNYLYQQRPPRTDENPELKP
jgi:flagellar biosynthesis protein